MNCSQDTFKKPMFMPDEVFAALVGMLESPPKKWEKACGIKRPKWFQYHKQIRFQKAVRVTKAAIVRTLSYRFYPESYIPRVDVEKTDEGWSLDIHTWGPWDQCSI